MNAEAKNSDIALTVNGAAKTARAGTTLAGLLASLRLAPLHVVVEYNGEPLDRDSFAGTRLSDGDRIEIAQMVGGG